MAKKTFKRTGGRKPSRKLAPARKCLPLDAETLAKAIEVQRQPLCKTQAIARAAATRLIATCDFALGEPVLGYCLNVIEEIVGRVAIALKPVNLLPAPDGQVLDTYGLAKAIDAQREQLFRAQAVAQTVAALLRATENTDRAEPDVCAVLNVIDETLDKALTALEPLCLGLPAPDFDDQPDEAMS